MCELSTAPLSIPSTTPLYPVLSGPVTIFLVLNVASLRLWRPLALIVFNVATCTLPLAETSCCSRCLIQRKRSHHLYSSVFTYDDLATPAILRHPSPFAANIPMLATTLLPRDSPLPVTPYSLRLWRLSTLTCDFDDFPMTCDSLELPITCDPGDFSMTCDSPLNLS